MSFDYSQWQPSDATTKTASPVTEFVFHHFRSPVHKAQRENVARDARTFVQRLYAELPSIQTFTSGWQLPDDEGVSHNSLGEEKATMFVKLLGWPSVEEHMKARSTQAFKQHLPNLKLGAEGGEMKHISFSKL